MNLRTTKYNFYELFWVFFISSFLGALIEIVFCYFTTGNLMSRSSLVYGQFSVVWGLGCVLLTIIAYQVKNWAPFAIFLLGFFAGGAYEYICSLVTEGLFGVRFWDYSDFPLNIDGRINLVFCIIWGIITMLWHLYIYPCFEEKSNHLSKGFRLLTFLVAFIMVVNIAFSTKVLYRGYQRQQHIPAQNSIDRYIDEHFSDQYIEKRYKNILPMYNDK